MTASVDLGFPTLQQRNQAVYHPTTVAALLPFLPIVLELYLSANCTGPYPGPRRGHQSRLIPAAYPFVLSPFVCLYQEKITY